MTRQVQRCGGVQCAPGTCDHDEGDKVHRRERTPGPARIPPSVAKVLGTPGHALDTSTRAGMEQRFGHDFGWVRVHTDAQAAQSAQAIHAQAYTLGRHVVMGQGRYQPHLTGQSTRHVGSAAYDRPSPGSAERHVVQRCGSEIHAGCPCAEEIPSVAQVGEKERATADLPLQRAVGRLDCAGGTASAPADPRAELTEIDGQARTMAQGLGTDLAAEAAIIRGGIPASPSAALQSFIDHFGLPPAQGKGFLNRLTGMVRPSQEIAMSEEVQIVSRRFTLVGRLFGDRIHYACGAGVIDLGGCQSGCSRNGGDAFTCRDSSGIGLCPSFWAGFGNNTARAVILIHEMFHIIWGPTDPGELGQIGDEMQQGSGRKFNVAGCYEFIVDDVFGTDSGPQCEPPVP